MNRYCSTNRLMIAQRMWNKCIQLAHADNARRSTRMRYDKDTLTQESFTSNNIFLTEFQDGQYRSCKIVF